MKATKFPFIFIACAVFLFRVGHADPANGPAEQKPSSAPSTPVIAAHVGDVEGKSAGNVPLPVHSPANFSLGVSSLKNTNIRPPNQPVIGGPASPAKSTAAIKGTLAYPSKNTRAISGTGISHKP
jgi:hypothetical protein